MRKDKFKIMVDGKVLESNSQFMTGAQIKEFAGVLAEKELVMLLHGHKEKVVADEEPVNLATPGIEKFESRDKNPQQHQVIFVEGRPVQYDQPTISYEEVIRLAGKSFAPNTDYSVLFFDGPSGNEKGKLLPGESVPVINNMKFNVKGTVQS
jgi:DNA mismatch repair ATPase MutL